MILGIGAESGIFLYAGVTGISVLCTYYILMCIRKLVSHSAFAAGIEDLIFWIGASVYIYRKMYETTYGSIRWFFVLGVLGGAGAGYLLYCLAGKIYAKAKKSLEKYRKNR